MSPRLYTIFWILLVVAVALAVAGGAYYFLFIPPTPPVTNVTDTEQTYGTLFPTGEPTAVTPLGTGTSGGQTTQQTTATSSGRGQTNTTNTFALPLRELVADPISGFIMLQKGSTTDVRYVEKATGRVYEIGLTEKIPQLLSNTTITKTQSTLWNSAGSAAVIRSFTGDDNAVQNLLASLVLSTSTTQTGIAGEMKGGVLPSTVQNVAISPDRQSIFYLNTAGAGVVGITADFSNKNQKQLFDSTFSEWSVAWGAPNIIALSSKPSNTIPGFLYLLNPVKKTGDYFLKNLRGLTASISPHGTSLIFSVSSDTGFSTFFADIPTHEISPFPITVLPEKCIWSVKNNNKLWCASPELVLPGNYPDDWYMGLVSFNDVLWEINIDEGSSQIVSNPSVDYRIDLDMTELQLNKDETTLSFINKKDSTLWSVTLEQ